MIGGDLITYRPDIQVLDATIRDGGLVNDFYFTDEFIRALYEANIKAGVDYMEFGYKASKEMFDVNKFGKWKFCNEEDIRAIVGENNTDLKISVMADVGRCDYKKDIIDRADSVIDLVRVATYMHMQRDTRPHVISWQFQRIRSRISILPLSCLVRAM